MRARILKSLITWSEMGQQTTQAKEVTDYNFQSIPKDYSNMAKNVQGLKIHRTRRNRIQKNVKNLETNLVFSNSGINWYKFALK